MLHGYGLSRTDGRGQNPKKFGASKQAQQREVEAKLKADPNDVEATAQLAELHYAGGMQPNGEKLLEAAELFHKATELRNAGHGDEGGDLKLFRNAGASAFQARAALRQSCDLNAARRVCVLRRAT